MGAGRGGNFGNTKGSKEEYKHIMSSLPKNPRSFTKNGWTNTTPSGISENTSSQIFTNQSNRLSTRFEKGKEGTGGYDSKCHDHKKRRHIMTISEFFRNYNLHDSLLEIVEYNKANKTVMLEIDFCYWQQENYTDDMKERGMVTLVFSDVNKFDYVPFDIDSDKIINIGNDSENELYIEVYNDITEKRHSICIDAKMVDILWQ